MIKNERQYQLTKAQANRFSQTLRSLSEAAGVHPLIVKVQREALSSQIADLEDVLHEYRPLNPKKINYMASIKELQSLITEPREDLDAEYKNWLDLTSNEHHKATLAKAAIAVANHGGGCIVIGFEDQPLESRPRPREIPEITQDSVNRAIRRYAEPRFHCEVHNVPHPDTGELYPVIIVPGTLTVPVMSRRDCQGAIAQNRCYIRKPGPESEEPQTSEEWRTLLNRCVRANRDEMLEAIRSIITGRVETQNLMPNALDDLQDYCTAAHDRWKELVSSEPDASPARFPHGYYEMAFSLIGATPANSLGELQDRLSEAGQIDLSGWPPFLHSSHQAPYPHEDFVEAWLGEIDRNGRRSQQSYFYDFWRASLDGKLYTIRAYFEDGPDNTLGHMFYTSTPVLRIGEGLLFASRFAETFEEVDQIAVHCRFTGLEGRYLASDELITPLNTFLHRHYTSRTDEVLLKEQITQQQVQDNLTEFLHPLLQQLYEKFNFFRLSFDRVAEELQRLRSNRF